MGENYAWPLKKYVHNDLMAYYRNSKENKGWKKHRNESIKRYTIQYFGNNIVLPCNLNAK
jgi:hypothetical protein